MRLKAVNYIRYIFSVPDHLEGWDGEGNGKEVREGGDMDTPMADSCWCMTEQKTTKFCNAIILQLKKSGKKTPKKTPKKLYSKI